MPFAAIFEPLVEESVCEFYSTRTEFGRTQSFFDCAAGKNAVLAGL
jgi:hypothetical protein